MTITRRALRLASLALAGLVLTATALTTTTLSAGAADSNKLTIQATEYAYKMSGSPKPGNVEVEFDNVGVEYHMVAISSLKDGVTTKQLKKALASEDEAAYEKLLKGDGFVAPLPGFLGPDQKTTAIVNLPAGNYGVLCFVPAPDGAPHVAHGMVATLQVSGSKSSYKPPTDGISEVKISDSAITLPSNGIPKSGWIKVTNSSSKARDLTVAQYLTPGATYETADAYFGDFFESGKLPAGEPPASINGGLFSIPPNGTAYLLVGLDSGRYALDSTLSEADDDPNPVHIDFEVK